MKCKHCGEEIANDSVFCEYCGTKVKKNKGWIIALIASIVVGIIIISLIVLFIVLSNNKNNSQAIPETSFTEEIVIDEETDINEMTPSSSTTQMQKENNDEVVLQIADDNIKVNTDFDLFNTEFDDNDEVEEYVPVEAVQEEVEEAPIVRFAEKMPEYPGGQEAMYSFLQKEIKYPEVALNNGIQGTVLLEFVVEKDGSISNVRPLIPLFPECDAEAMRVVKKMPKWKPGEQMGKPVRCYFNLPIRFTLH